MRLELIGFGTIEFEDRTLMVARARPQGQQPKITPLPVSSAVSMLPRLVAFVCFMVILEYGGCSQVKSQPCCNGT